MTRSEALLPTAPKSETDSALPPVIEKPVSRNTSVFVDVQWHLTLFLLSLGIFIASVTLQIHDARRVAIPVIRVELPETCNFKRVTGKPCPGCGLTRAFISLAHGRIQSAWQFNAASLPLFVLCVAQIPWQYSQLRRIRRGLVPRHLGWLPNFVLTVIAILLLTQWCLRLIGG